MLTDENQQAEPQDVSKLQAFVRSAARAPGMRPGRTWLTAATTAIAADPPAHAPRASAAASAS
jgi:hypothetical protein